MEDYSKNPIKRGFQIIGDLLWIAGFHVEASIRWFGPWSTRMIMVHKQRLVLAVGTILVVVAGLFPPWNFVALITRYGDVVKKPAGHSYLFSGPTMQLVKEKGCATCTEYEVEATTGKDPKLVGVELDWNPLPAEWITLLLATVGLFLLFQTAKAKSE